MRGLPHGRRVPRASPREPGTTPAPRMRRMCRDGTGRGSLVTLELFRVRRDFPESSVRVSNRVILIVGHERSRPILDNPERLGGLRVNLTSDACRFLFRFGTSPLHLARVTVDAVIRVVIVVRQSGAPLDE